MVHIAFMFSHRRLIPIRAIHFIIFALIEAGFAFLFDSALSQTQSLESLLIQEQFYSARATAMGGAYTTLSSDASALSWNPAGLSHSSNLRLSACGAINFSNVSITLPTTLSSNNYDIESEGTFNMNLAGITIPLMRRNTKIVWGISLQNFVPFQKRTTIAVSSLRQESTYENELERRGNLYALSSGLGIQLFSRISLGISYSILSGHQQTDSTNTFVLSSFERSSYYRQQNDFSGNVIRIGVRWRVAQQFSIGSCFVLPHQILLNDRQFGDPVAGLLADSLSVILSKPFYFSAGCAWHLAKNFIFSFDYHYKPWQNVTIHQQGRNRSHDFHNAHSFHMGSEVIYETSFFTLGWQFGFYTQPEQLFEQNTTSPQLRGDQISSHFITTGLSILTKHFSLDLSISYQNLQYKAPTIIPAADLADIGENNYSVQIGFQIIY